MISEYVSIMRYVNNIYWNLINIYTNRSNQLEAVFLTFSDDSSSCYRESLDNSENIQDLEETQTQMFSNLQI